MYHQRAGVVHCGEQFEYFAPVDAASAQRREHRRIGRFATLGLRRVKAVLDARQGQVVADHGQAHGQVLAVQGHVAKIRIDTHQLRIHTAHQVHDAGAVRADARAAVGVVTGLHAVAGAERRKLFQPAPGAVQFAPVVIPFSKPPVAQFDMPDTGLGAARVEPLRGGGARVVKVDRGGGQGAVKSLIAPDAVGGGQRPLHIVEVHRVARAHADIDAVVPHGPDFFSQFGGGELFKKFRIQH